MKAAARCRKLLPWLLSLGVLVSGATALAGEPVFIKIPVDMTQTVAPCGFPLTMQSTGAIDIRFHTNQGSDVFQTDRVHISGMITNPANGKALPFQIALNEQFSVDDTGTSRVAYLGLGGKVTIPGEGIVVADMGKVVLNLSEGTVESVAGQFAGGPFPTLCSYLDGE